MKKLTLLLLVCASQIWAQSKTYQGTYPLGGDFSWVTGKATYTYTEDASYNKIKNGGFLFTSDMNGQELQQLSTSRYQQTVKGQYKENLKDGAWSHSIIMTNISRTYASIESKVAYAKGLPNGVWSMTAMNTKTNKVDETMMATFKNGVLFGTFKYKNDPNEVEVTGTCDENGYMHGKVTIISYGTEKITEYVHGVPKISVNRDVKSGEVSSKNETSAEDIAMYAKLESLAKTNPDALADEPYKLIEYMYEDVQKLYNKKFVYALQLDDFPGDEMYGGFRYGYQWNAFKVKELVKQTTRAELEEQRQKKQVEEEAYQQKRAAERAEEELNDKVYSAGQTCRQKHDAIQKAYAISGFDLPKKSDMYIKKRIYKPYLALEKEYEANVDNAKTPAEKLESYQKLYEFYNKILELATKDTNELEKQLKKVEDLNEIRKILGL